MVKRDTSPKFFWLIKLLASSPTVSVTLATTFPTSSELLKLSTVFILISNKEVTSLVDIGSIGSFIAYDYAKMDSATGFFITELSSKRAL